MGEYHLIYNKHSTDFTYLFEFKINKRELINTECFDMMQIYNVD